MNNENLIGNHNQDQETEHTTTENLSEELLTDTDNTSEEHPSEEEHPQEDYSTFTKEQLFALVEPAFQKKGLSEQEIEEYSELFKHIKPYFDDLVAIEKEVSLQKFLAEEGAEEADFDYKQSLVEAQFYQAYHSVRKQKSALLASAIEEQKKNLETKKSLIEKLREVVYNTEETDATIQQIKQLQKEWKSIGPIPRENVKPLWDSYNALIEAYYNNRSLYNDLKDLDRKRNLEAKEALCEQAEKLSEIESIKEAIKQLNVLHEEFKHIGPVGKEHQEQVWERFKKASDAVYHRRKHASDEYKAQMQANLETKKQLSLQAAAFETFTTQSAKEWNQQTKKLLEIQKKWEEVGPIPKEHSSEINKSFWHSFKVFFKNKSDFFKALDEDREQNLSLKIALCQEAEALIQGAAQEDQFEKTAESLKKLQEKWKGIGPVPEKKKEEVFQRFKTALDGFFNSRREKFSQKDKDEKDNYNKKVAISERIESFTAEDLKDLDLGALIDSLITEWTSIGFVPKKMIDKSRERFLKALKTLPQTAIFEKSEQKDELELLIELKISKALGKMGEKDLEKKQMTIRKKIGFLEDEVGTLQNNMGFFSSSNSKQADSFKASFEEKIADLQSQIVTLKNQLKLIRQLTK